MQEVRTHITGSILYLVALLFLVGISTVGAFTYLTQHRLSEISVNEQIVSIAEEIVYETESCIKQYPAYQWLIDYWYDHCDELDIEYDAEFTPGNKTSQKAQELITRHPELLLEYVDAATLEALDEESQKLYAEVTYSWVLTRIDQIKISHEINYLFCIITDDNFDSQFFLFSAADPGAKRGTNYEEVYYLGVKVTVSQGQQEAMRNAMNNSNHLVDAGNYVDYYSYFETIDGQHVMIGMTYDLSGILKSVDDQTEENTLAAVTYQVILSFICMAMISFYVLRPLKRVQQNIRLYRITKDSEKVIANLEKIRPNNEIGQLSQDVCELTEEIDSYVSRIESITSERERVNTELNMAREIQEGMLPNIYPAFPERTDFDIYATMDPAREVGGDFYDFFLLDDDHLYIAMADVSGKGIPGALFMMESKIILQNIVKINKSPAKLLMDANNALCSNNKLEMFVTAWVGILELSTGKLTAASAGHEYPIIYHKGSQFAMLRDKHGFVMGVIENTKYTEYELQLAPGDKLFLYTDGVTEAMNSDKELFGMDRLIDALNKDPKVHPVDVLKNVREGVDNFVQDAEQFDDLTMLCMEYKGVNTQSYEITIDADVEKLPEVLDFVEESTEALAFPVKKKMQIALAVEEIYVNIANYAYTPDKGTAAIRVDILDDPAGMKVTLTDSGMPFNPLQQEKPDITLTADERDIGGLGIYMAINAMDETLYEYKDGKNILTMIKYL